MIKTHKLKELALDWMVAVIEEPELTIEDFLAGRDSPEGHYRYSEDWAQGGLIIDREKIEFNRENPDLWRATIDLDEGDVMIQHGYGPTHLIAAMRCHVESEFGDEVNVPEELL